MKNILLSITLLLSLTIFSFSPLAFADAKSQIQCGVNAGAGVATSDCKTAATPNPGTDINALIAKIINILSVLAGAAAVIMLIVGGFRYVTSAGNDTGTAAARKTITYALIGLVVVAVAQVVVHFVLNSIA